jgi:exonuclease I
MFLVFDTETTDLLNFKLAADDPAQARIVQLACMLLDADLRPVPGGEVCHIIKPDGWVIQPGAARAHGISIERCHDEGVPIVQAIEEFDDLAAQAETLVAYNIKFDAKLVRGERRRLGREDRFGEKREFCAMWGCNPIYRNIMKRDGGKGKLPKLTEAHAALCGSEMSDAHDAMGDVIATVNLLRALRTRYKLDISGKLPTSLADKPQAEAPLLDREEGARKPSLTPHVPVDPTTDDFFNG